MTKLFLVLLLIFLQPGGTMVPGKPVEFINGATMVNDSK
jgi:hypothetical protein